MEKGKITLDARWANFIAKFRKFPAHSLKVIAVYGTGATDVSNLLLEVLKADGRRVAMLADKSYELAGHREFDDLQYKPTASLFQRFFAECQKKNMEFAVVEVDAYAMQKSALYNVPLYAGLILADGVGADELTQDSKYIITPDGEEFLSLTNKLPADSVLTFGRSRSASARIDQHKFYKKGTEVQLLLNGRRVELATFIANENAPNGMAAVAALASVLSIPNDILESGIANYVPEGE
jgi:UDP-N-acetylmuramyl tripeptide synthase